MRPLVLPPARRSHDHSRQQQPGDEIEQSHRYRHAKYVIGEAEEQVLLRVAKGRPSQLFTPSPAIAVLWPSFRNWSISVFLSSGRTPARTASMPRFPATTCSGRSFSPVALITRGPCARSSWITCAAPSLIGSATATIPAMDPSTATNIAVLPWRAGCRLCLYPRRIKAHLLHHRRVI